MDNDLVQITREKTIPADELNFTLFAMHEEIWHGLAIPQLESEDLAHLVEKNVVTPPGTPVPDCRTCGACCAGFVSVPTAPHDEVPDEECWEIVSGAEGEEFVVDRYVRRRESDFACAHLSGEVGGTVSCAIYDARPRMCRVFEAGSDRCHATRRAFGLEPYMTVEEMLEARRKLEEHLAMNDGGPDTVRSAVIEPFGDGTMSVLVVTKSGREEVIHRFDPGQETWYRAQFEGRTIEEVREMIVS